MSDTKEKKEKNRKVDKGDCGSLPGYCASGACGHQRMARSENGRTGDTAVRTSG